MSRFAAIFSKPITADLGIASTCCNLRCGKINRERGRLVSDPKPIEEINLNDLIDMEARGDVSNAAYLQFQETMKNSMEAVASASVGLSESWASLADYRPYTSDSHWETSDFAKLEPVVNPGIETNERLEQINTRFDALINVAKHQDELIQAINNSTQSALQIAVQSAKEAKEAAKLAKNSLRITLVALIVATSAAT